MLQLISSIKVLSTLNRSSIEYGNALKSITFSEQLEQIVFDLMRESNISFLYYSMVHYKFLSHLLYVRKVIHVLVGYQDFTRPNLTDCLWITTLHRDSTTINIRICRYLFCTG